MLDPRLGADVRVTLPKEPEGVAECLQQAFPEIPSRALTKADVMTLLGEAKLLDRAKTQCGDRAVTYIRETRRVFAK